MQAVILEEEYPGLLPGFKLYRRHLGGWRGGILPPHVWAGCPHDSQLEAGGTGYRKIQLDPSSS